MSFYFEFCIGLISVWKLLSRKLNFKVMTGSLITPCHPVIQTTIIFVLDSVSVFTLHSVSWFCCITGVDSLAILCRKSFSGAGCFMCQECIGYLHRKGHIWSRFHIGFISVWVWHLATSHMRDVDSQTTIFALDSVSVWSLSGSSYSESDILNS